MEDWVFQIQRMLADKLNVYRGRGNSYVDNNIREIQELYKDKEQRKESKEGRIEEEEVILIKLYKTLESKSSMKSSFIDDEIEALMKYIKFIQFPI